MTLRLKKGGFNIRMMTWRALTSSPYHAKVFGSGFAGRDGVAQVEIDSKF